MNTFIDYPIYGNEEEMAVVRTGEIVKANRKIGYRRCLTKNAKKDLFDRYGTLYMSTLSAIQQFDPACCTNVFVVLSLKVPTSLVDMIFISLTIVEVKSLWFIVVLRLLPLIFVIRSELPIFVTPSLAIC